MIKSMMVQIDGRHFEVDTASFHEIAVGLSFVQPNLRLYGGAGATKRTYESGGFKGSVKAGGSCNVDVVSVAPHLDGTHTETVAHISTEPCSPHRAVCGPLHAATLVTIRPDVADEVDDELPACSTEHDRILSARQLDSAIRQAGPGFVEAMIIRTLPNPRDKKVADYGETEAAKITPYFSRQAMQIVVDAGVRHLIVDTPSVDRLDDASLRCHRVFFRENATDVTITELAYIADAVSDGSYILNLQLPAWATDAVPSRPLLLPVRSVATNT